MMSSNSEFEPMLILIKFGSAARLRVFREEGLLHMKTLRYFAEQEKNVAKGDPREGTSTIIQADDVGDLTFEHRLVGKYVAVPGDLTGAVRIRLDREVDVNVFCMFAITEPQETLSSTQRKDLGDHFVVVLNSPEFLRRVKRACELAKLVVGWRCVTYYDEEKYSGRLGPFAKPARFACQNEFRIAVSPGQNEFREIALGSIEDITTPVLLHDDIDELLDFSPENARAVGLSRAS